MDRLTEGQQVGEWILQSRLGGGGVSEVWRARHVDDSSDEAAIKFPRNDEAVELFRRGARLQGALKHKGIVRRRGSNLNSDPAYLVMELCRGGSLRDVLRSGPISVERAKEILKQIVDAVAAAHEKGIVHGDLKPENVLFLEPDRMRVKLTDFDFGAGSADLLRRSVLLSTEFGDSGPGVGGTAYYISPEVNAGAEPTKASDVFAIGVMLNEMLTGSPFPIVIPVQNAGAALSSLVAKSVDRDPTRRPPDAAALLEEIGRAEAPPPKKRPAAGAGPVQAPVPPPAWVPPEERAKPKAPSKPPPKNKPGAIVAGIFGCTVLAALAALVAYGGYKVFTHYDKILGFFRNAIQAIFRGEPKYVFGAIVVVAIIARIAKKQK